MFNLNLRNLTNTLDSCVVQVVTKGAFTAEGTVCVDADSILADTGVILTLVHIYRKQEKMIIYTRLPY